MFHDPEPTDLTVTFEGTMDDVSEAEVLLIESYLGDLIQRVLLTQDEKG